MAQKLLTPFKKLPQQIQNFPLFQKLQDLTTGRHNGQPQCFNASVYGILDNPRNLAYDQDLCLLAVAYANGQLEIYGTPGLSLAVDFKIDHIMFIEFLRNEGRLIVATCSSLVLLELDTVIGCWKKHAYVELPFAKEEKLTAMTVGKGVIYVGSNVGTLRQVAVEAGRMSVGDDELTSLPCHLIQNKISNEQLKESLKLELSQIVSIELDGEEMLIGFSSGTVLITKPQPLPVVATADAITSAPVLEDVKEDVEKENIVEEKIDEKMVQEEKKEEKIEEEKEEEKPEKAEGEEEKKEEKQEEKKRSTGGFDKKHFQAMKAEATKKFRTLSKTIKSSLIDKIEDKEKSIPPLPVAPSPHITHILPPYSSTAHLRCASWRVVSLEESSETGVREVIVAYDDGAHLTWKLHKPTEQPDEESEAIVLTNQEVASIPYGPLPCAAIERILVRPSTSGKGGVITAFVGGLPRAQHGEKHTLSVLGGHDEHVCFQFSSAIRDLVVLPRKRPAPTTAAEDEKETGQTKVEIGPEGEDEGKKEEDVEEQTHVTMPATPTEAAYIIVLTEKELVTIDLTQTSWPVIPSPYIQHIHTEDVTAAAHTLVSSKTMSCLRNGIPQPFSSWPVEGGKLYDILPDSDSNLLALGRSTGVVSLYEVSAGDCFHCLGHVDTLAEGIWENFEVEDQVEPGTNDESIGVEEDEAWPPFRRVGNHHRHHCRQTKSVRHAIHCLSLIGGEGEGVTLLVGGGAGNLSIWSMVTSPLHIVPAKQVIRVDLLAESEGKFVWEGASDLKACEGSFYGEEGALFTPTHLIQMHPATPITSAALAPSSWSALAVGSHLGFAVIDLLAKTPQESVVYKQFTRMHATPLSTREDGQVGPAGPVAKVIAQGRLLKNNLRSSFRKLRKSRSRNPPITPSNSETKSTEGALETTASAVVDEAIKTAEDKHENSEPKAAEQETIAEELTPAISDKKEEIVETDAVEPEVLKDGLTSFNGVQCLLFADTFVDSATRISALFVGTRGGFVTIHQISWPAGEGALTVRLVKEMQLKHTAPILGMVVLKSCLKGGHSIPLSVSDLSRSVAEPKEEHKCEERKEEDEAKGEVVATEEVEGKSVVEAKGGEKYEGDEKETMVVVAPIHESHELLICTEEQVKLFALPSLKPKRKYRFWGDNMGAVSMDAEQPKLKKSVKTLETIEPSAPVALEEEVSPPKSEVEESPSKEEGEKEAEQKKQTEEDKLLEIKPEDFEAEPVSEKAHKTGHKECLRRVASFGLHQFSASGSSPENILHLVIALHNGSIVVLDLPALRRVLKTCCCYQSACRQHQPLLTPCVSSAANLVFWPVSSGHISVHELAFNSDSLKLAISPTSGLRGPGYFLELPEWARPKSVASAVTSEEVALANTETDVAKGTDSEALKEEHKQEEDIPATTEIKHALMASDVGNNTAQEVGDITLDSIKDYLNDGSGANVTVKTTESSLEKHTVIEGGNVVTTVHETERIDGEVTKDDLVQVKSSGDAALSDAVSAEKLVMH